MSLSLAKRPPCFDLTRLKILIHGPPGAGKSTLLSAVPDAFIVATQPGGYKSLDAAVEDTHTWEETREVFKSAVATPELKTFGIDTVDDLWNQTTRFVLAEFREESPNFGVLGWGNGGKIIASRFRANLQLVASYHFGVVMVSHTRLVDVETATGTAKKWVSTMPDDIHSWLVGWVDVILFVDVGRDGVRTVYTQPSSRWEAKDRTGRLPATLPLSWPAFVEAMKQNGGKA